MVSEFLTLLKNIANFDSFQETKAVTACLNTKFRGFSMQNQQLGDTPMPFFPKTSVKSNMSKEEIAEVIGILTEVLGNANLEINELKTKAKDSFQSIEDHRMSLVKYHKDRT